MGCAATVMHSDTQLHCYRERNGWVSYGHFSVFHFQGWSKLLSGKLLLRPRSAPWKFQVTVRAFTRNHLSSVCWLQEEKEKTRKNGGRPGQREREKKNEERKSKDAKLRRSVAVLCRPRLAHTHQEEEAEHPGRPPRRERR